MSFDCRASAGLTQGLALVLSILISTSAAAQKPVATSEINAADNSTSNLAPSTSATNSGPATVVGRYFDPLQGTSSNDLVRRALTTNGELMAARLDVERARARLRQAGLRPNPTIDFEQMTGALTGSAGERETSIGVALPLEMGGKRRRRIELAQAEFEAAEAEIADRERRLANDVRSAYAEALAAVRELEITGNLNEIDQQTARFVQARVNEGESAPIELNLLRVEVDRLRSRRALVEGKLQASILRLKSLTGIPVSELLRLSEDLNAPPLPSPPASADAAMEIALRTRPDLRLARLTEEVALAGLRLARAEGVPDITPFTKFTISRGVFDDTPVGILTDKDKLLSFGVSVGIPVFNRNQGAKAEAALVIDQAKRRREFLEQVVRTEVQSAFARYEAARAAIGTYDQGVITRSNENIRAIRGAYQIGEFKITDLLTEQRRLVDSQREFTEALTEQYRALADLQAAMGTPIK